MAGPPFEADLTVKPIRIGHRGAAGHAPENTLAAIEKGISLGAEVVEIDVQCSRDGQLVVFHDVRLERTTNGRGFARDLDFKELRLLRTVPGDLPLASLSEVLELVNGRVGLMIELKVPGLAAMVVETVRGRGATSEILYASFFHDELLRVREMDGHAGTIALFEGVPVDRTGFLRGSQATHAGLALSCLAKSYVSEIQEQGFQVFTFTANRGDEIALARACGVDGIISDYPERI